MNNCGCKRPATGPEPHAPVPLHGGGFVPNAIEWLKKKIDRLFGTVVFTVNGHAPEGGNVNVIVPSKVSELENDAGYLTEHQDVSGIAATAEEALSVATDAAQNSVRIVNGKAPTGGSVKIVLDDLADKDGNIETTKTIMVSRDGGESHVAVALYSDLISEIDTHNNNESAHPKLMATVAEVFATKTEVEKKYDKTGGPISGDVSITGSLSLTGSAPKITANQKDFSFPTESGKLARAEDYYTTAEVDNKITTFVAHYLTGKDSTGHFVPFATRAALDYAKQHHTEEDPQFFYAGEPFTPTKNDYCVVLADETVGGKTARYSFVGEWPTGSWQYQYTINDTAFSEAQWAAINSGVTGAWMESTLSALQAEVDRAQAAETQLTTKAENAQSAADAANAALVDKLDKTAVVAPSVSATAGQAADAKAVNDALAMKAPSNITTASDDKIRIVYGDNVWWIVPLGIYYWNDGEAGEHAHSPTAEFALPTSVYSSSLALTSDIDEAVKDKADRASLAPEYSPSAAYPVGSIVYHDGNIYQCTTAIAEGGEAWTAAHWEMMKLDEFFTASNSLLTGTIDARLPYPLYAVPSTGLLKDRAINTTSLASATVPDNFTDLIVRASVASSLSVTMPGAIATKYGDAFPGEAGEYLITITKTGASEAYVRTIKLEVANA